MTTEEQRMKPCPFCGGEAHQFATYGEGGERDSKVQCKSCGAEVGRWLPWTGDAEEQQETDEKAIDAWNQRADTIDTRIAQARREALEEAAEAGKEAAKRGGCHHVADSIRALIDKEPRHD